MAPHSSENQSNEFGAAVEQFRRALDRRVDAHLSAHPHAGTPRMVRAATARGATRHWALGAAVVAVIVIWTGIVWPTSFAAFTKITILESFLRGMKQTAGPVAPVPGQGDDAAAQRPAVPVTSAPDFEEASIRRCDSENLPETPALARGGGASSVQMTPGRLNALCVTVATLVRTAYGYSPMQLDFNRNGRRIPMDVGQVYGVGEEDGQRVRGGPDWVRSERYTIEAVAGAGVVSSTDAMAGPMLLRLLERRLQLRAHIETEPIPAYTLTVAKGGLKIKPVSPAACQPLEARPGSGLAFGHPTSVLTLPPSDDDVRRGAKPACGSWGGRAAGPNVTFVAGDVPIEALAQHLGFQLGGVRVLDKTGVTDRFNFFVEFARDENTPGLRGIGQPPPPPPDGPRGPNVFSALEEQLGLRLERASTPREFIVIDQVERPSPN